MTSLNNKLLWEKTRLDEVAQLDCQSIHPSDTLDQTAYLGLEHLNGEGGINLAETVASADLKSNKYKFSRHHILYGKLRPYLRKISRPDFEGICSTDIIPILPGEKISRNYLFHFLRTPLMVQLATNQSSGANLPRLNPKRLASFHIPLPPLSEQKRIAGILDTADALRVKRRESLVLLDKLIQSTFLDMFGDPVTNPMGWEIRELGKICDVRDGTHDSPKYVEEGYPLLTSKNFKEGQIQYAGANLISKEDFTQINKRSKVDVGDLVMPMIGTIGNPVLVEKEPDFAVKNVALIKFSVKSPDNRFIRELLCSHYFDHITSKANRGGTQKFVALKDLRGMSIPFPPIQLQRRFAAIVESIQKQKERIRAHLSELDTLFASLQQKAFNGEL
jgi:type I restriction enzyme S subunit